MSVRLQKSFTQSDVKWQIWRTSMCVREPQFLSKVQRNSGSWVTFWFFLTSFFRNPWMKWPSKTLWRVTTCTRVHSVAKRSEQKKGGNKSKLLKLKKYYKIRVVCYISLMDYHIHTELVSRNCHAFWASTPWGTLSTWWPWWRRKWTHISPSPYVSTWHHTQRTSSWAKESTKKVHPNFLTFSGEDIRKCFKNKIWLSAERFDCLLQKLKKAQEICSLISIL